jgi:hypothetical protein
LHQPLQLIPPRVSIEDSGNTDESPERAGPQVLMFSQVGFVVVSIP